jgi:stage II sporulation protein D
MRALLALLMAFPLCGAPVTLRVRVTQGGETAIVRLPLEKYVAGVLAGESSVFRSAEALKAMAVAARTYAVRLRGRHSSEGFDFCGTTHCQRVDLEAVTLRLESVTEETAGELLWFEGRPAFAYYSRDCGGRTEDGGAVWPDVSAPYLRSHADPYCTRSGGSSWQWTGTAQELAAALRKSNLRAPPDIEQIAIYRRTASGRAQTLVLSGGGQSVQMSASALRFAVGRGAGWNALRSDHYEVRSAGGHFVFQGSGAGHGVGLCQTGAEQMGADGHSYREILTFYYPGALSGLTAGGLHWLQLGGESVVVLTTQPDRDRVVLTLTERLSRDLAEQTSLRPPGSIEIRAYPDVESYRDATGEPGWVAAHTVGSRIHLQPTVVLRNRGVLEQTLRHEVLHVLVENRARPGLPVWFREGLVGFLDRPPQAGRGRLPAPNDSDLRQTEDPGRARRAYSDATRKVAALVDRYGKVTVLGWLDRGMPPELKNSSSSQPPVKSR